MVDSMDYKLVLCFMLLSYSVSAFPKHDEHIDEYQEGADDDDDQENEYESTLPNEEFKTNLITEKPKSQYEVTEIVVDIPDDRTKGPIDTNYTIYKPLNTVLAVNKETIENATKTNSPEENKKTTVMLNKSSQGKTNSISIFHVKAEFEDKTEKTTPQVVNFYNVPHLSGLKDYFNGIKQGIVNGFNNIIHKHKRENVLETPGPLAFLSKLHKKNSDSAHKIHDLIFGDTIDENF